MSGTYKHDGRLVEPTTPTSEAIRDQLGRILKTRAFSRSTRRRVFLQFIVAECLAGRQDELKEFRIGEVVFDKKDFDPSEETTVRTAATRLRRALEEYYATDGANDPILIGLPKGGYVPQFTFNTRNASTQSHQIPVWWFGNAAAAALVLCVVVWLKWPAHSRLPAKPQRARPLFGNATSEGHTPPLIGRDQRFAQLLITPDGRKLYALSADDDRSVVVFGVQDLRYKRAFRSPIPLRTAFMCRDGQSIYISSTEPQVVVVDTASDNVKRVIPTGQPAFDIAVTADNRKLFLALGSAGLKRFDLVTGDGRVLSPLACPIHLDLDPAGRNLFVAYECGGPGGRAGHDVVDIYDVDSEQSVYTIMNLPMVGEHPLFGTANDIVLLEARDACTDPKYDHEGCPQVPSHTFHLWRTTDRRLLRSFVVDQVGALGPFSLMEHAPC